MPETLEQVYAGADGYIALDRVGGEGVPQVVDPHTGHTQPLRGTVERPAHVLDLENPPRRPRWSTEVVKAVGNAPLVTRAGFAHPSRMGQYRNLGGASLTVGTGFEPSRPVGAGRGPIRSAMANDSFNYSLKDRMAARRADKEMAGATGTAPAQAMQPPQSRLNASPTPRLDAQPPQSRLDASPTPRLDAQNQGAIRYNTPQSRMAEQRAATEKSTLNGAFGQRAQKKAENLQGRKALYRKMQGGQLDSATARKRASALGVDEKGFNTAAARIEGVENFRNGGKPSWKTPPPLTADIGKADVRPNKRKRGM